MKPKNNSKDSARDHFQTPPYAVEPLLPFLNVEWQLWESAMGQGILMGTLRDRGYVCHGTDLPTDYFEGCPRDEYWQCQVTNPPYSKKYEWISRAYELGKPFALLMPADTLHSKKYHELWNLYGGEVILMSPRVDYKTPNKGWDSSAQFASAWFTWKLGIGQTLTFADISEDKKRFKAALKPEAQVLARARELQMELNL